MNKNYQLTFYKSELNQYNYILKNEEIKSQISIFLLRYVSLEAFYKKVLDNCSVKSPWKGDLPEEVVVTVRQLQEKFYFVQNFINL